MLMVTITIAVQSAEDCCTATTMALTSIKQMITGMLSYLDFACFLKSFLSRLIPLFSGALQVIATRQNMLSNDCDLNVQSIMVICYSNNAFERCIELLMTNLYIYKKMHS